ncbi:hypothetical protein BDY24DRAFT_99808 [Mrakia frigida]|uniref:uncharacterized protein n=1 Tax=Mrakia frigida TaxID=29902 RepID=UPI003FCC0AC7
MSIRERLLDSVTGFLSALESKTLDKFNHHFALLFQEIEDSRCRSGLSASDQQLAAEVSSTIESLALKMGQLQDEEASSLYSLRSEVDSTLAAEDDCSASCSQPHSHFTLPFQRSPTPPSPPTTTLQRAPPSNDSGSDNDSDSEDSPKNNNNNSNSNGKKGAENPANFRHLRDWFLEVSFVVGSF